MMMAGAAEYWIVVGTLVIFIFFLCPSWMVWILAPLLSMLCRPVRSNRMKRGLVGRKLIGVAACMGTGMMVIEIMKGNASRVGFFGWWRSFETVVPSVDLHWYILAEVFPRFR